jgi:hypothetical protein
LSAFGPGEPVRLPVFDVFGPDFPDYKPASATLSSQDNPDTFKSKP